MGNKGTDVSHVLDVTVHFSETTREVLRVDETEGAVVLEFRGRKVSITMASFEESNVGGALIITTADDDTSLGSVIADDGESVVIEVQ